MIIYKITNTINGKVYIGQTSRSLKKRWRGHCASAVKNKSNNLFHNAIQKYGVAAFMVEQIDFANDRDTLNKLELFYIEKLNTLHPNGYNLKTGGSSSRYSEISKKRMSQAKIGTVVPDDVKDRMSKAHIDRWKDAILRAERSKTSIEMWKDRKYREKISSARVEYWSDENNRITASIRGKAQIETPGHRQKISDTVKASYKRADVKKKLTRFYASREKAIVASDGSIYRSIKVAAATLGLKSSSIVKVIKGKYNNAGGLSFKYLVDAFDKKPVLYVVAGVSGSGKSWICSQIKAELYTPYDLVPKEDQKFSLLSSAYRFGVSVFDPCVGVSTYVSSYSDIFDVRLLVILDDIEVLKTRLIGRGGEVTESFYTRYDRILSLAKRATFFGTSNEVLDYLKNSLTNHFMPTL